MGNKGFQTLDSSLHRTVSPARGEHRGVSPMTALAHRLGVPASNREEGVRGSIPEQTELRVRGDEGSKQSQYHRGEGCPQPCTCVR